MLRERAEEAAEETTDAVMMTGAKAKAAAGATSSIPPTESRRYPRELKKVVRISGLRKAFDKKSDKKSDKKFEKKGSDRKRSDKSEKKSKGLFGKERTFKKNDIDKKTGKAKKWK